ncbi:MAG: DUF2520 domain-containing protein [Myxococcota bacterium]
MKIGIVGPGRLGRSLQGLLKDAGYEVSLHGRDSRPQAVEVCLLTVPDSAVAEVASGLTTGPCVLHCAGSLDLDVLEPHSRRGSFHPLMTFPGPEVAVPDVTDVPVALAGTSEAVVIGQRLADDLGMRAFTVPGDRRLYHAAAVIAGNLVTVLLDEAATVLERAGVPRATAYEVLQPLALRSVSNAHQGLRRALTGPIARDDRETLAAHREALAAQHPAALPVYDAVVERAKAMVSEEDPELP